MFPALFRFGIGGFSDISTLSMWQAWRSVVATMLGSMEAWRGGMAMLGICVSMYVLCINKSIEIS